MEESTCFITSLVFVILPVILGYFFALLFILMGSVLIRESLVYYIKWRDSEGILEELLVGMLAIAIWRLVAYGISIYWI